MGGGRSGGIAGGGSAGLDRGLGEAGTRTGCAKGAAGTRKRLVLWGKLWGKTGYPSYLPVLLDMVAERESV